MDTKTSVAEKRGQPAEEISGLRKRISEQRDVLFRRGWKNQKPKVRLKSRGEVQAFEYVVEWYEEFDEVVGKDKEKKYFDELIAAGMDVNKVVAANKAAAVADRR